MFASGCNRSVWGRVVHDNMGKVRIYFIAFGLLALACLLFPQRPGAAENKYSSAKVQLWQPSASSMSAARYLHAAALLPKGKVLITGGGDGEGSISSSELYDPATGTFSATGSMAVARRFHTATLLRNGKVLVAGGIAGTEHSSAELYDPAAGTFSPTGPMKFARSGHIAVLLPNGKVLVAGGYLGNMYYSSAELYDPASGTFAVTGSMSVGRGQFSATLLPSGKVLVAGGDSTGATFTHSADLYDPATGIFSATGSMSEARFRHSATLLPNGKVLMAGGANSEGTIFSAELYDPATGTFSATGSLSGIRQGPMAILLPNGKVLVTGGADSGTALSSSELYDPVAGTFSVIGSMGEFRASPTATLLSNGKVLVAGGHNGSVAVNSAELYSFQGGRVLPPSEPKREPKQAVSPSAPRDDKDLPRTAPYIAPARAPLVVQARPAKMPDINNVAVADFIGNNVSQADASIVAGFLRTELVNTRLYKVMDRSNMDTVLSEQKFQNSGCTEQECAVEIGKLLNVRRMFVGSLSKLLDNYYITVNVVDVGTGEIVASYDSDGVPSKKLKDACKKIVEKISRK